MKMFTYRVVTNLISGKVCQVRCADVRATNSHTAHEIALAGGGTTVPLVARDPKETPRSNYPAPPPPKKT